MKRNKVVNTIIPLKAMNIPLPQYRAGKDKQDKLAAPPLPLPDN